MCGHAVEEELEDPVEHLDQERELLQDARVEMPSESRRVGCSNGPYPKDAAGLARVVRSISGNLVAVDGGPGGAGSRRGCYGAVALVAAEDGVILRSGEIHGGEEDSHNQLERDGSAYPHIKTGRASAAGTYESLNPVRHAKDVGMPVIIGGSIARHCRKSEAVES